MKTIKLLFLFYLILFLLSACNDDCTNYEYSGDTQREYTDVKIQSWDTSGFGQKAIEDSVHRVSFGLTFILEEKYISQKSTIDNHYGYSTLFACDPVEVNFIDVDPIQRIEILVEDQSSKVLTDVTNNFKVSYYNDSFTIDELLEYWPDNYSYSIDLALIKGDNIPKKSNFTLNIYLESGKVLSDRSGSILFYGEF